MVPVYCVGETLEQFEKGLTKEIVGCPIITWSIPNSFNIGILTSPVNAP